ncbi:hypothetical protein C8R46DRAFT_1060482 [Mycena filopes]|nr:hypothetical protein C8R46DRAFT_1060482 [Mycena filopes]
MQNPKGRSSSLPPPLSLFFLLLLLAGSSTAQTITGTLFGVAYPTAIVQFTNGAYDFPGPVLFIGNHPQIDILGVGAGGQTTFSYRDIITQNVGGPKGAAPVTVTQDGILVQNAAPQQPLSSPSSRRARFDATGAAICEFYNDGNAADVLGNDSSRAKSTKSPTSSPTGSVAPVPSPHKVPVGAIVGAPSQRTRPAIPLNPFTQQHHPSTSDTPLLLSSSGGHVGGSHDRHDRPPPRPRLRRERRRRLKANAGLRVQQLQRNLSVQMPESESGSEPQVASQQRQIAVLLSEVERLRAIVARDEALPAYEE